MQGGIVSQRRNPTGKEKLRTGVADLDHLNLGTPGGTRQGRTLILNLTEMVAAQLHLKYHSRTPSREGISDGSHHKGLHRGHGG